MTCIGLMLIFFSPLERFGNYMLHSFNEDPHTKLIFVMVIFPTVLNSIQFWFTDNYIKYNENSTNNGEDSQDKGYNPLPKEDAESDDKEKNLDNLETNLNNKENKNTK
jgi:hypothetical protein